MKLGVKGLKPQNTVIYLYQKGKNLVVIRPMQKFVLKSAKVP